MIFSLKFWPYLAAALLGASMGGYLTHKADGVFFARLQVTYANYQTQVADEKTAAEKAAADALSAQIADHKRVEAHNETVMAGLRSELSATDADRNFARRLLAAAQAGRAAPGDRAVPEAGRRQPAPGTAPAPGGGSLVTDLGAAATEVRRCFATAIALQDEVRSQL